MYGEFHRGAQTFVGHVEFAYVSLNTVFFKKWVTLTHSLTPSRGSPNITCAFGNYRSSFRFSFLLLSLRSPQVMRVGGAGQHGGL